MASPKKLRLGRTSALLALPVLASSSFAGNFLHYGPGTYLYTDTANWGNNSINNTFNGTLSGDQTITFTEDYTASGTVSITLENTSYNQTFASVGGIHTITLGGSFSVFGKNTSTNKVIIANTLNINVGTAQRKLEVYIGRTLEIQGVVSGGNNGGVSIEGVGTIRLANPANTFKGTVSFLNSGAVLEVTKLADAGTASSLGVGDGVNNASRISFSNATGSRTGGTLRYIGTGDSTNRRFRVGNKGAQFDASGSGAVKWTNTASLDAYNSSLDRTITLKGTNTDDNTMAASFGADIGTGKTSFLKDGEGTWVLEGNNLNSGNTTINQGVLALGARERLNNTTGLILNGGTFAIRGYNETLGTLDVNFNATIDFGAGFGASALVFADSSAVTWGNSVILNIINFNEGDSIRLGTNQDSLSSSQLGKIRINGHSVEIDQDGYLSMATIPEPSNYAMLGGTLPRSLHSTTTAVN